MSALDVALLRALRKASTHLDGGDLAAVLHTPAEALRGAIDGLRAAGFEIEQRPGLGYRLLGSPDRLMADDLFSRMSGGALIREILVFAQTDSTNDQAAQLGRNGAAPGVAVFAERQNAGRGRFGRRWESAAYLGLWGSLLLRPELAPVHWPRLTTCAAVAIAAAIEKTLPLAAGRVRVKWPNDLQIDDKKVAGILIETGADRDGRPFAVLGFGLNANHLIEDFPAELQDKATSLREICGGRSVDRAALAVAIFAELEARLWQLAPGFESILADATRRSSLLGRFVQLRGADSLFEGVAEGLDPEGRLLVRAADGVLHSLSGGEVTVAPGI